MSGREEYTLVLLIVTIGLGLLMVSNSKFRSFNVARDFGQNRVSR